MNNHIQVEQRGFKCHLIGDCEMVQMIFALFGNSFLFRKGISTCRILLGRVMSNLSSDLMSILEIWSSLMLKNFFTMTDLSITVAISYLKIGSRLFYSNVSCSTSIERPALLNYCFSIVVSKQTHSFGSCCSSFESMLWKYAISSDPADALSYSTSDVNASIFMLLILS